MMTDCDNYPDPRMLDEFPNWVADLTGKSRFVVDGCHVKPQKQAERIQADTDLSVGEVCLSDGTQCVALIKVADAFALGIIVYDEETWGLVRIMDDRNRYDLLRFRVTNQWNLCDPLSRSPTVQDSGLFPLNYCTRLICTSTRGTIQGTINAELLDIA